MPNLPANIYSVAAVRETDRTAIEDHGVPGYTLMARAAAAAMREVRQRFPDARRWQIICGAGNNGGDGYVMARLAAHDGIVVSVLTLVDVDKLTGDAATAWGEFTAEGGVVMPWAGDLDDQADLLIDGILGSGLEREVGGEFADAVARINAHPARVVSLDIPTGIHGDTGNVLGTAVQADMTVTFVGLKSGLFLGDGPAHCGVIRFADLEIPESYRSEIAPAYRCIDECQLAAALKPRARGAHKGDFGHVLMIGGGQGMPGAVRLAGEAALRAGAGRVSIATHPSHAAILAATRPELMSHGVTGAADLAPLLENADVVALGPGLGQSEWAQALYDEVAESPLPAVWDADALNLLAKTPNKANNRVITPHPGEAATLLNTSTADIQANRPAALAALAEKYGGTTVLKGSGSLVSTEATPVLCLSGNPGMAAPGMGDVLTGIVAGLLAQGLNMTDAAAIGVEAHARAGDRAALAGERGMLASDLMAELRAVLNP
jgi:NAD(P)H-hydrate epimerase